MDQPFLILDCRTDGWREVSGKPTVGKGGFTGFSLDAAGIFGCRLQYMGTPRDVGGLHILSAELNGV